MFFIAICQELALNFQLTIYRIHYNKKAFFLIRMSTRILFRFFHPFVHFLTYLPTHVPSPVLGAKVIGDRFTPQGQKMGILIKQ